MSVNSKIGFGQRVQLEWMEYTAGLQRAGYAKKEILAMLKSLLEDRLSPGNPGRQNSRGKTISILLGVWVSVPKGLEPLRDEGLLHLERLSEDARLPVHWGMSMAAYPFFAMVAETTGRLLRLQGTATAGQVQRRMGEQLGQRPTIAIATRRVLRSFVDWSALRDAASGRGVYEPLPARRVENPALAVWLTEAMLIASGTGSGLLSALVGSPAFFPFDLRVHAAAELDGNPRLEFLREGLDQEIVILNRGGGAATL